MSEQIHARVAAGRKEEWKEHITNHEVNGERKYNSMTDLIREAVKTQIQVDTVGVQTSNTPTHGDTESQPAESQQINELVSTVDRLETVVSGMDNSIQQAVDSVHAQQGVDPDTITDVLERLPVGEKAAVHPSDLVKQHEPLSTAEVRYASADLVQNSGGLVKAYKPFDKAKGPAYDDESDESDKSYQTHYYKTEEL